MKNILTIGCLIFVFILGCDSEIVKNNEELSLYKKLTSKTWEIKNIQTKLGTHDPDKIVPPDSITVIDSGSAVTGSIKLEQDSSITVNSDYEEYYFSHYDELVWKISGDSSIRFIRYDNLGNFTNSFGYQIRFRDDDMQWYNGQIMLHSGEKSIRIITLN